MILPCKNLAKERHSPTVSGDSHYGRFGSRRVIVLQLFSQIYLAIPNINSTRNNQSSAEENFNRQRIT